MFKKLLRCLRQIERTYIGGRYHPDVYREAEQRLIARLFVIVGHPLVFLASTLALGYLAYREVGRIVLWVGISAVLTALVVNMLIKGVFRKGRPLVGTYMTPIPFDEYSFPSAHAATSFAFAAAIGTLDCPLLPLLIGWAVVISGSRILSEAHHFVDILAGMALGILVGLLVALIALRL